jgi:hypothetical protein
MTFEDNTIRDILFAGFTGCSNHNCVITGPKKGMGTNGSCHCIQDMNRAQLNMLAARIGYIADRKLKGKEND